MIYNLKLKANDWTDKEPYIQTLKIEGLLKNSTGSIRLSDTHTLEERKVAEDAYLTIIDQGDGYLIIKAKCIRPIIDLPIILELND